MKDIPFEAAKEICEQYEKDQCIILTWDKASGDTWVTTYGVGDQNSIQACTGGAMVKDFLKLKREEEVIPTRFEKRKIEDVDRFYYVSGRNVLTYQETTYWYEKHTRQRKETTRSCEIYNGDQHKLPDWAKGITARNLHLESSRVV